MGRRPHTRRVVAGASLLAVAALACGEGTSPRERLARADSVTAAEGSASLSVKTEVSMRGGSDDAPTSDVTLSGSGTVDLQREAGRMEIEFPGLADPLAFVFDGRTHYVRLPALLGGDAAPWVRQESPGPAGRLPGSRIGGNPLVLLDRLGGIEGDVRPLGPDTVRGTKVNGFAFTLTGGELWGPGEGAPDALDQLTIPSEIWLDDRNRVRRMVTEIDLGAFADAVRPLAADSLRPSLGGMLAGIRGSMTWTADLYDFGIPVSVEIPSEADVISATELRRRMRRSEAGSTPDR